MSVLSRPMATTNETLNPVWTGIYRDASVRCKKHDEIDVI